MKYIEALENFEPIPGYTSLFLAGGITGCPDWQGKMVKLLEDTDLILLNPRRADFPIHDLEAAGEQIAWEHHHLYLADAISFWFCKETLQPVTLYELGAWSMTDKPLFVGVHPDYLRRQDVEIQTKLARPEVTIVYSLPGLAKQIMHFPSTNYR